MDRRRSRLGPADNQLSLADSFIVLQFVASGAGLLILIAGLAEHQHFLRDLIGMALLASVPLAAFRSFPKGPNQTVSARGPRPIC